MKKVAFILPIFVSFFVHAQNPLESFLSMEVEGTYSIVESIVGEDTIPASGTIVIQDSIFSLPTEQHVVKGGIGFEAIVEAGDGAVFGGSFGGTFRIIGSSKEIWFEGNWDSGLVLFHLSDVVYITKKQDSIVFKVNRFDYIEKNLRLQKTDTEIVVSRDIVKINRDNNEVNLTFPPKAIILNDVTIARNERSQSELSWEGYDSDSVFYVLQIFEARPGDFQFALRKTASKFDTKNIIYKIRE